MIIVFFNLIAQIQPSTVSPPVFIAGPRAAAATEIADTFIYKTLN